MAILITDEVLEKVQMSGSEFLIDIACYMYEKKKLSMGKARTLSNLDQISFQKELGKRSIDIHYTEDDLKMELDNLGITL